MWNPGALRIAHAHANSHSHSNSHLHAYTYGYSHLYTYGYSDRNCDVNSYSYSYIHADPNSDSDGKSDAGRLRRARPCTGFPAVWQQADNQIYQIDPATGTISNATQVTLAGFTVSNSQAMAARPSDGYFSPLIRRRNPPGGWSPSIPIRALLPR